VSVDGLNGNCLNNNSLSDNGLSDNGLTESSQSPGSQASASKAGLDPLRQCVSCRVLKPRSQLWRVVRLARPSDQPHGHQPNTDKPMIQLDQGMGRSAYLCPQKSCLEEAQKRKRLDRSLRTQVPAAIYTALITRLVDGDSAHQPKKD
jgi:predicted RNA-binding protein YlxR (DUF448 family)